MKSGKRCIIMLLAFLFLGGAWGIRFVTFNREIRDIKVMPIQKYEKTGEWIPFGDNYLSDSYCNGYSIRIDSFRIVEYETYMGELADLGYQEDEVQEIKVEKVLEAKVTLKNEENVDKGIPFLSAWLFGEDFYTVLNIEWFEAVNFLTPNSMGGVSLRTNTEYQMKLPYCLTEVSYREKFGRNIEKEKLWLKITGYPEERWVRVQ